MSKPITIDTLSIVRSDSGAKPTIVKLILSNGKKHDVLCGAFDSQELMFKRVGNAMVDINSAERQERLSRGLVEILIEIRKAVGRKNENSVHLRHDLALDKSEYNNAQKLRYHGLITKDEKAGAGYWLITRRGAQFLAGELSVPQSVTVKADTVIDHDEGLRDIVDVMTAAAPRFDDKFAFIPRPSELEFAQAGLGL